MPEAPTLVGGVKEKTMTTPTSVRLTSYPGPREWRIPCVAVAFYHGSDFVATIFPEFTKLGQGEVCTIIVNGMSAVRNHSGLSFKLVKEKRAW